MTTEAVKLAKSISHEIWQKYNDLHGYRTIKQARNAAASEKPEDIWFFWNQFDSENQTEFTWLVIVAFAENKPGSHELHQWVSRRLNSQLRKVRREQNV